MEPLQQRLLSALREDQWSRILSRYHQRRRYDIVLQTVQSFRKKNASLRVLDAGCGDGVLVYTLEGHGLRVVGVDVSAANLRPGQAKLSQAGLPADLAQGVLEFLPFKNESFDIVLCVEVIGHTMAPPRAFRELERVLATGGVLILSTPNALYPEWLAQIGRRVLRFLTEPFYPLHHPAYPFHRIYFPWGLWGLANAAGLRLINLKGDYFDSPYPIRSPGWERLNRWVTLYLSPHFPWSLLSFDLIGVFKKRRRSKS